MGARCRSHWPLAPLLAAFLVLGSTYSVVTPVFEAHDEVWHYPYVKLIADGQGLPILRLPVEANVARQEGAQPPLYYLLGALLTFWMDTGDFSELPPLNPHGKAGNPAATDNKNLVLHTEKEDFPYQGAYLAIHLVRWLSVLMGAATVLATYLIALEVLPGQRVVATGAAALNAFNPQFLFTSGAVNNDNLVILLSSLSLLVIVRLARGGLSSYRLLGLGLLLGLTALSKLSGLGLIAIALLALGKVAISRRSASPFFRSSLILFLPILAVAGWWYARNWALYGDPLGLNIFLALAGGRRPPPTLEALLGEAQGLKMSFWAVFGGFNITVDPPIYMVFDALSLFSLAGIALFILRWWRGQERPADPWLLGIPLSWMVIIGLALLRWTQMTLGSQGRLLFPAISAISLFLSLGLASLVRGKLSWMPVGTASAFLLAIALISPFYYIAPSYPGPPLVPPRLAEAAPHRLDINYGGKALLLGYDLDKSTVHSGEDLGITLYWRALDTMREDFSLFIHLFGEDSEPVGQLDTYPGKGTYPTSRWRVGDNLKESYTMRVSSRNPSPIAARIEVGLYWLPTLERMAAFDPQMRPLGTSPVVGRFKLAPAERPLFDTGKPVGANFENKTALVGYRTDRETAAPASTLGGSLYWRALDKMDRDYTVFVQLLGPGGLVAQHDAQPRRNTYPTSLWDPGEVVEDEFSLPIPAGLPSGSYRLIAGMYQPSTGQRLWAQGEGYVELGKIEVVGLPPQ